MSGKSLRPDIGPLGTGDQEQWTEHFVHDNDSDVPEEPVAKDAEDALVQLLARESGLSESGG